MYSMMRVAFGNELRGVNPPAVHAGLANLDLHGLLPSFAFLRHTQSWNYFGFLTPPGGGLSLFFNGAAYFTQVFPKRITRIDGALLQIPREVQLFAQRAPAFDRLCLTPFSLPDFVCRRKQVIGVLCKDKQATIVIGKNHIIAFDDKIPKARRVQRRGIANVESLRARGPRPVAENWQPNLSQLWCVAMRAPDNDSSETTVFSFKSG